MTSPDPAGRAASGEGRGAATPPAGHPENPVVVWGAGAMGGSIGASLHRAGRAVVLVDGDPEHVAAVRARGLEIRGPVEAFTRRVPIHTPEEVEGPLGPVLLAVKAHHTDDAMVDVAPLLAPDGYVVSVQNGLNERVIGRHVGDERTVGCFVNFGADVVEPGVILRGNRGAVVVGELDGRETGRIREIHALLRLFEPEAVLTDDIHGYLWGKLAYGALLFATALTDATIADVLASERHRPALIALAREVVAVARARGVRPRAFDGFDPGAFGVEPGWTDDDGRRPPGSARTAAAVRSLDELVAFNRASAKARTGVWRDLAVRMRKTEVDAQIAPVAELGAGSGVPTPLLERLVTLVHEVEEGRRPQSWETLDALEHTP